MGVAPAQRGAFSTIPPYRTGGNIDTRHVTAGATLFLPVEVEGALFSIGDGHAAQGDGGQPGTAIETPMKLTVRLTVVQDTPYVQTPHFATPSAGSPAVSGGCYCTTGVDPDIREATRTAVRGMIAYLGATHGLSRTDAYMPCSVAGDLRMHEVVRGAGSCPCDVQRFTRRCARADSRRTWTRGSDLHAARGSGTAGRRDGQHASTTRREEDHAVAQDGRGISAGRAASITSDTLARSLRPMARAAGSSHVAVCATVT
ncbi:hypothetical protein IEO21_10444 [Rhodonia placenta]|uniref:Uncharacterized protein n=1 Tax=Rhodonia placenta TaxID=104341 RepID=A0A8H7NSG1_9APHY|nr:hypothetical protein IEO21_10444 [Postia placenta]